MTPSTLPYLFLIKSINSALFSIFAGLCPCGKYLNSYLFKVHVNNVVKSKRESLNDPS